MTIESATYIDDLNTAYPADTDQILEGDNHIRLLKTVLKNTFPNIDGAVAASDEHLVKQNFAAVAAPVVGDDSDDGYAVGTIWVDVTNDKAYLCIDATVGAAVWMELGGLESGTRALFQQTAAPTGWTKDTATSNLNNSAMRFTTGTVSAGGAKTFTTVFANNYASDSTTITGSSGPQRSHTHTYSRYSLLHTISDPSGSILNIWRDVNSSVATGAASNVNGGAHTHTVDMDVYYHDVIIASKD